MKRTSPTVSFFAFQDVMTCIVGIFILIFLILAIQIADAKVQAEAMPEEIPDSLSSALIDLRREHRSLTLQAKANSVNDSSLVNSWNVAEERERLANKLRSSARQIERASMEIEALREDIQLADSERESAAERLSEAQKMSQEMDAVQEAQKRIDRYSAVLETDSSVVFRNRTPDGKFLVLVLLSDSQIRVTDSSTGRSMLYSGADAASTCEREVVQRGSTNKHYLMIVKPSGNDLFSPLKDAFAESNLSFGFDVVAEEAIYMLRTDFK